MHFWLVIAHFESLITRLLLTRKHLLSALMHLPLLWPSGNLPVFGNLPLCVISPPSVCFGFFYGFSFYLFHHPAFYLSSLEQKFVLAWFFG